MRQRGPTVYVRPYLLSRVLVAQLQAAGLIGGDVPARVISHLLMILSVGLFSISELVPQEQTPPFEEVADALAQIVQRALAPEQPGDSEQGKRALRTYLEQLARGSAE